MLRVIAHHPRTTHGTMSNGPFDILGTLLTSHQGKLDGIAAEGYIGLLVAALAFGALLLGDRVAIRWMVMVCSPSFSRCRWAMWDRLAAGRWCTRCRSITSFATPSASPSSSRSSSRSRSRARSPSSEHARIRPECARCALAAMAWSRRLNRLGPRLGIVCGALGALATTAVGYEAVKTLILDDRMHEAAFSESAPIAVANDFRQARGNRWDAQVWAPAGRGTLQCLKRRSSINHRSSAATSRPKSCHSSPRRPRSRARNGRRIKFAST